MTAQDIFVTKRRSQNPFFLHAKLPQTILQLLCPLQGSDNDDKPFEPHSYVNHNGNYKNRNGELDFKDIELKSVPEDSVKTLIFTSDFFDIEIDGKYDFQSFVNTIKILLGFLQSRA